MGQTIPQPSRTEENIVLEDKPLVVHLRELRRCLLVSFLTILMFFGLVMFTWPEGPLGYVISPLKQRGVELIYLGLGDVLYVQLKLNLLVAVIFAVPMLCWQFWSFVGPGLYPKERRKILVWMVVSILLFGIGAVFGYYTVFLSALSFFVYTGQAFALPILSIDQYVSFLLSFILASGIVFELPLGCYILGESGLITGEDMRRFRKYYILLAFILSALITPTDVLSQVLMAIPMLVLYEVSIYLIGR